MTSLRRAKRVGVLTATEFESVIQSFPRLSDTGKEVARLALVEGIPQADLVEDYDKSFQQISRWVNTVYSKHLKLTEENA